ncbi:MAG: protein phosphatase CheZ, partial [Deltaproteobacteria bacterium]|nr:protein phosphatase CheZ [Deltaproteobacteria bacterium]
MSASPPVIGFEVGVGEFRIVTPEAVYEIRVIPELVRANTSMGVVSPAACQSQHLQAAPSQSPAGTPAIAPAAAAAVPPAGVALPAGADGGAFFQEISQELFERVGQLARKLSISVTELPPLEDSGLSRTGADLEDAKGQLEEVVEITEKASLQIMDIADLIQADMDSLNGELRTLSGLGFLEVGGAEGAAAPGVEDAPGGAADEFAGRFARLKELVATLAGDARDLPGGGEPAGGPAPPVPEAPPGAAGQPLEKTVFVLPDVFETLYQSCTNETVKDHIKKMEADAAQGGFDTERALEDLSSLAEGVSGDEDGFYMFPIPALLKLLYTHTASEENKTTLKKMNQTVGAIFLEQTMELQGTKVAIPAAEPPTAPPPPPPAAGDGGGGGAEAPVRALKEGISELAAVVGELDSLIASGPGPGP